MILQALYQYYDALAARGEISPPGWCDAKVSFALDIDESGTLRGVIPLKRVPDGGKKEIPQTMRVPEQVKKTSGVAANFLCENSSYFLGVDGKGNPTRSRQCFEAAKTLHGAILSGVDSPAARGVLGFFDRWQPENAEAHPALADYLEEIKKGANLVFSVNGQYAQQDPAIREAWQNHCAARSDDAVVGRCLVTGQTAPIARLHPAIKGVQGAQSSGASLVAFNATAFESYGHELADKTGQGLNAPVSESAAFAYGTVLNRLLADREHVQYIGDTAVLCWAEDAEPLCQDLFCGAMFGSAYERITQKDLWGTVKALADGAPVDLDGIPLHPENHFYVLGLAPSAARLSVRFFLQDTFGNMLKHLLEHYQRLEIAKPSYVENGALPLWRLLGETVNPNSREKKASPPMAGAVARSVLTGGMYPVSLFEQTMMRIRAEQTVSYGRAAIIKAFLTKNDQFHVPKEVLTVELNEQSAYLPYVLGRLFAVLERVQLDANPNIKATIKDKYFNSASSSPATVFPLLTKLSQSHLRKLNTGLRISYEKRITELEGRICQTLPAHMSLPEQGAFHLGYYHQVQKLYEKKVKEDADHV
ncbi:MAG: type I-C CRISPR-associated protein Cas8c/Csd1 [Dysosmobacter sp.]|nr:type I-C CRISPR-associated protein Cas8c/Csd1 [Dysosmobacter sp.]